jgi:cysteinyl-tRNA synthetase
MKKFSILFLIIILIILNIGCIDDDGNGNDDNGDNDIEPEEIYTDAEVPAKSTTPLPLSDIDLWAYQIQDVGVPGAVDLLARTHYDMLVLEPTRTDWSSDDKFFDTQAMVDRLKGTAASDGEHRKLVIAYIDIGEAEDWRWYWTWSQTWVPGTTRPDDWPEYIITHDPDGWEGNYPVAYWDQAWKDIVIHGNNQDSSPHGNYNSILDEVIKDGFDGIYLDWVEGFENVEVIKAAQQAGVDPAVEMIKFIGEMRQYADARTSDFLIIQQNAAALCDGHSELFTTIDAIAQEAIWFDGDAFDDWYAEDGYDSVNDNDLMEYYLGYLDQYLENDVPVFDCEYALDKADDAYEKSLGKGYVPYCTRRSLSKLTTTLPSEY